MRTARNIYTLILFIFIGCYVNAQEPTTIRFKKESDLAKVVFDNTEDRLVAIDRFGNPRSNKVVSYKLYVKTRRDMKEFSGYGNNLSDDMKRYLRSQKKAVKLFFTEITALDDDEHPVKLPDLIEAWFPDCKKCPPDKP